MNEILVKKVFWVGGWGGEGERDLETLYVSVPQRFLLLPIIKEKFAFVLVTFCFPNTHTNWKTRKIFHCISNLESTS